MSSAAQSCTVRACPRAKERVRGGGGEGVAAYKKWPAVICCCCRAMAAPKKKATTTTAGMIIINNNETLSASGPCGCSSSSGNNSGSCNSYSNRMANSAPCSMQHAPLHWLAAPLSSSLPPFPIPTASCCSALLSFFGCPLPQGICGAVHAFIHIQQHTRTLTPSHSHTLTARLPGSFIDKQVLASLILGLRNASSSGNKCRQRFA